MQFIDGIEKLWPLIAAIIGVIWKQISDHFEQKVLKENQVYHKEKLAKLEGKMEAIEEDLTSSLKDQSVSNAHNFDKINFALTELIRATTRLTTQFEMSQHNKSENHDKNYHNSHS